MEEQVATVTKLMDTGMQFAVAYGFQLLGALVVLLIGLKLAGWIGRRITALAESRNMDVTLARFFGNVAKLVALGAVIIVALDLFGITIAPLIALAAASAFGITFAFQGLLANYGAGLSIILGRPFVVGSTITVHGASGVVEDISLAHTVLIGEDGERITVPNRRIVGEILTDSHGHRVVESKLCIGYGEDQAAAIDAVRTALEAFPELQDGGAPQVGVHDFTYGGIVLGLRFWVPSRKYFRTRYAVNETALRALNEAGITLLPPGLAALPAPSLTADAP